MLICIDPGHGLGNRAEGVYDPGAVSAGVQEADVALAWALTLRHELLQAGISNVMTRRTPESEAYVGRRARFAQMAKATHFLSLHCNASLNPLARGTETLVRGEPTDFAENVHLAALSAMGSKDRGVKDESKSQRGRLAVLGAPNPCLLEIGFITNPSDRRLMLNRDVRILFARALIHRLQLKD